jgi:hypothetical protein
MTELSIIFYCGNEDSSIGKCHVGCVLIFRKRGKIKGTRNEERDGEET